MKAFEIGLQNGLGSLRPTTRPEPRAEQGEVVVAPRLVGLISRDLQILRGTYGPRQSEQRIPVSEGVGRVISVGAGVSGVNVGDRVVCGHFVGWLAGPFRVDVFAHDLGVTHDGWLAERIVLPAAAVVKVPGRVADEDVAGLASGALTAWNALVEVSQVRAGDLVLCLGTGSVSIAALKIAKLLGARVAITSSDDEKLEKVRQLGADITINYLTHPQWGVELMRHTGGVGANVVIETGGTDTLAQSMASLAVNGRIVVIGVTPGPGPAISDYLSFITRNISIRGIANGNRKMMQELVQFAEKHHLKTEVSKIFAFSEAPKAFEYFQRAGHVGKVMVAL